MRVLGLTVAAAGALLAGCSAPLARTVGPVARRATGSIVRVQVRDGNATAVRQVPIEDYVAATLIAEVDPPSADAAVLERMFEVQAIISRTYALSQAGRHGREGFDVCSSTHCQRYDPSRLRTSRWADLAREAVTRTAGEILWYDAAPARVLYHADCGGHTSDAAAVWGGTPEPYLVAERDEGGAHTRWHLELTREALREALAADARTSAGARLDAIDVVSRDAAGRASVIDIAGARPTRVRGETLREVVTRALGPKSLRSTLFSVRRTPTGFVFDGRGFGHGVGLCQAGAFARLEAGASPAAVLKHYFPGTELR
jgi:stage II sporulation protein D